MIRSTGTRIFAVTLTKMATTATMDAAVAALGSVLDGLSARRRPSTANRVTLDRAVRCRESPFAQRGYTINPMGCAGTPLPAPRAPKRWPASSGQLFRDPGVPRV